MSDSKKFEATTTTSREQANKRPDPEDDLESLGSEDSDIEGSKVDDTSDNQADKIKAQLAKRETAQVFRLRLLVFLVLALAAG